MDAINFRSNRRGCPQTSYYVYLFFFSLLCLLGTNRFVFLARPAGRDSHGMVGGGEQRTRAGTESIVRARPANAIGSLRREER